MTEIKDLLNGLKRNWTLQKEDSVNWKQGQRRKKEQRSGDTWDIARSLTYM